jgi:nucleoside-diphosphate-sugar epimerase
VRVLVTGATGFVGHALTRRLLEIGWPVAALLREGHESRGLDDAGAELRAGDLADPNSIAQAAEGCEVIFHCAGESSAHASSRALSWIHVAGTENVVHAARHAGVKRLVHLSCADVSLLNRDRLHWKEDAVLTQPPLGNYARSKLLAEELALQASDRSLMVTALRPAWLWGAGDHTNLPMLCAEARTGGVRLFGRGHNLMATTHVENVVDALLAAAQSDDVGGRAFHVSDAEVHTAAEFFGELCGAIGLGAPRPGLFPLAYAAAVTRRARGAAGAWPTDVVRRARGCLLDCMHAHTQLDYSPGMDFEEGLTELAEWVREQGGPGAIEALARPPATDAEAAHFERLADAAEAASPAPE